MDDFEKLRKDFEQLPEKVIKKLARDTLRQNGKLILATAKQLAPKDTKQLTKTIKLKSGRRKRGVISVDIRTTSDQRNIAMEYGTSEVAAQPFLRPALRRNEAQIINKFELDFYNNIKKEIYGS